MKLHRNVYLLGLVSLFADFSSQMVYPLLPQLLVGLGAGAALLGLVEGIAEATASLLKPIAGRWSDRRLRRKPFVFWGYLLAAVSKPLFAFATTWAAVLTFRFTDRLGKALRNPPRDAILAESVAPEKRGLAYGLHLAFDRAGAILGPLLVTGLLFYFPEDFLFIFLLAGIPGVFCLLFLIWVREPKRAILTRQVPASAALTPQLRWLLAALFVFTLGNSSDAFLLLKAGEMGLFTYEIPLLWALYNLICALSAPLLGRLSDRIGRLPVILASFVFYGGLYLAFAQVKSVQGLWLLFGLYGIYYGLSKGIFKAYIADMAPPEQKGTAFGLFDMWTGIALVLASLLMGVIWESFGSTWAFTVSAGLSFLGLGIFLYGLFKGRIHLHR